MSTTFVNGYTKDVPLRNNNFEETLGYLKAVNMEFGRMPLKHSSVRVSTSKPSI